MPTPTGKADKLIVVCTLDKRTVQVPLSQILLVKAHETAVSSNQEFFAGSTAALRCSVHGVKSVTESIPLPHSTVQVGLKDKAGKVTPLYQAPPPITVSPLPASSCPPTSSPALTSSRW